MTTSKDGSVLFAVYGTLRQGWGNHRLLAGDNAEYLGTMQTLPQYTLYALGGFPGVTENGTTAVTVEIYRVTDSRVAMSVNSLEGYTGTRGHSNNWYDTCDVETEWGTANMFIMNQLEERGQRPPIIESGDWAKRS